MATPVDERGEGWDSVPSRAVADGIRAEGLTL